MAGTKTGRALRVLLPPDPVLWAPDTIYVEVGTVLRRWDLNRIITPAQIEKAVRRLAAWPLRVAQARPVHRCLAAPAQHHLRRRDLRSARRAPWGGTADRRPQAGGRAHAAGARAALALRPRNVVAKGAPGAGRGPVRIDARDFRGIVLPSAPQVSERMLADLRLYRGRGRRRSGDLALFRRALYRLSYPAGRGDARRLADHFPPSGPDGI